MPADKGTGDLPMALPGVGVSLRSGTESDLPALVAIEQLCFLPPWSSESFLRDLRNPSAYVLVAEQAGKIIGYLCCWLIGDEAHILKVAVHPNRRRLGVAKGLLLKTLAEVRQKGACTASLEVRRS